MAKKYGIRVETIMLIKRIIFQIKYELIFKWKTKYKISKILARQNDLKLEIGAGARKGTNGWITLDINNKCDLRWDLRDGIPFPDNSVTSIYSSHLFEHIPYSGIRELLMECKRVLKPDATFSICVPNAKPYIMGYANNDLSFWKSIPTFYGPALAGDNPIDMINYIAYMHDEHKYLFDEDNLVSILNKNGFKNARIRPFDMELDTPERDFESIYAIASVDK